MKKTILILIGLIGCLTIYAQSTTVSKVTINVSNLTKGYEATLDSIYVTQSDKNGVHLVKEKAKPTYEGFVKWLNQHTTNGRSKRQ